MKNKFKKGELVIVNGKGKIFESTKGKLGFIVDKDEHYGDYYINLIFDNDDYFSASNITRAFENDFNNKYQIRLCTTKEGYNLLKERIIDISNNENSILKAYKEFQKDNKKYIVVGCNSKSWNKDNKYVKVINELISNFKYIDIPFKYIILNRNDVSNVSIIDNIEIDKNVDVLFIESNIKIKD